MLRILDRYVLRELMAPFGLALLLLTFALEIPPILQHGETLIAEGASWDVVARVLATLVPQALGITIPMALLVGILIALGRLSADREVVAMEACGVSPGRLLRPLLVFALIATAATTYVMIVALPAANQAFREITFKLLMTRGETKIKPRVFYTEFPNLVIYVREVTPGVGWSDVMVSESSTPTKPKTYLAKKGRLILDESKRTVQMVLVEGTHHSVNLDEPEKYEHGTFAQTTLVIDPESVFPRVGPMKGPMEMTIAELKKEMDELRKQNIYPHNQIMAWQKKYSIPAACLAFMLVAIGMGVSHRRDGRLAAFVLGIGVVFVYWVLMYMSEAIAKARLLPVWFAWLAMWVPNLVVALWGLVLIVKKLKAPEQASMRFTLPFVRRGTAAAPQNGAAPASKGTRVIVVIKIPHVAFPRPSILDWYVLKQGMRVSVLAASGLLALFYIASFIDLSDHLFTGRTSWFTVVTFLWWASPRFIYYLVPLAVLMGALVTIGALTKNTELVVMKACGISLYRAAAPLLILAVIGSVVLLGLEEGILAVSNRRADAIDNRIRGRFPTTNDLNRRWVTANNGDVYQYVYFESGQNRLNGLSIYEFGEDPSTLRRRAYFSSATFKGDREAKGRVTWQGAKGWERQFAPKDRFSSFTNQPVAMEGPGYFASERPDAQYMSYRQLSEHVASLQAGGFNVVPYVVALHRKIAFPFVTLIMALIAVPFAVTTGKRGAMYGIGAGIVLAILYWTAISVFGAVGAGGLMPPALAAWAPNIIFGCAAMYLLLTVRT
jgi:LPS export ABC transporter permease LptG/LPS export ABC transporter permease LptF